MKREPQIFVEMPSRKRNQARKHIIPYIDLLNALIEWQEAIDRSHINNKKNTGKYGQILKTEEVDRKIMELRAFIEQIVHSVAVGREWVALDEVEYEERKNANMRYVSKCENCGGQIIAKMFQDGVCGNCDRRKD